MTIPVNWRKSSRSQNGGNCVEVRNDLGAVRDSKNPNEHMMEVSPQSWKAFVRSVS